MQRLKEIDPNPGTIYGDVSQAALTGRIQSLFLGSVYHPNLLTFSLFPFFDYTFLSTNDLASDSVPVNGNLLHGGGLFNLTAFGKKPFATSVNYRNDIGRAQTDFFYAVNRVLQGWGARTGWSNPVLPVSVDYSAEDREEIHPGRRLDIQEQKVTGSANWQKGYASRAAFNAGYGDLNRKEDTLYDVRQSSNYARADLMHRFDSIRAVSYYGSISWNQVSGLSPNASWLWTNTLSKTGLAGNLNPQILHSSRVSRTDGPLTQDHELGLSLRHQLYESLESTAEVRERLSRSEEFTEYALEGGVGAGYRKRLPLGVLAANFNLRPTAQRAVSSRGMLRQKSIAHRFDSSGSVLVRQEGVIPERIRVTSGDGLVVYQPDLDFRVSQIGDYYEVFRTASSTIPDSTPVVIRYEFAGPPAGSVFTVATAYGVSHGIGSDLIYGYRGSAVRFASDKLPDWWNPDERTEHTWYANFHRKPVLLGISRALLFSSIVPTKETQVNAGLDWGSASGAYSLVRGDVAWRELPQQSIRETILRGTASAFTRLGRFCGVGTDWRVQITRSGFNPGQEYDGNVRATYDRYFRKASIEFKYRRTVYEARSEMDAQCIVRTGFRF